MLRAGSRPADRITAIVDDLFLPLLAAYRR
jgi:hypothetical protein